MKTIVYVIPQDMTMIPYERNDNTITCWVNDRPQSDKWHDSLMLCGMEITQLHAITLTAEQIEYLSKRIRSVELGQPDPNYHVNIWKSKDGIMVQVGEYFFLRTPYDRFEFQRWLDEVLV